MRDLIAIILSLLLAIAAAGVMWGWWRSPIPTFMLFGSVLHGMMLGASLMWLVGSFGVRRRARRAMLGVTAGFVSVVALAFGQYLSDAYDYRHQARQAMAMVLQAPSPPTDALDDYDRHLLEPKTGYTGIIGYVRLQNRTSGRAWVSVVETLLVIGIATTLCIRARHEAEQESSRGRPPATVD